MNTFGTATIQVPLCDPRPLVEARRRWGRDALPLLERANSFFCPISRYPSRGWVLLTRRDYDLVRGYSTQLQLTVDKLAPFKNLSIVQARCVSTGILSSKDALYLVEITDARGLLWNRWFQFPTIVGTHGYNCRAPAYPQQYYSRTLNAGVVWTWSTMIGDIWNQMSTYLGTFTSLPATPAGTPENWWASGVAAWPLLCDILDRLGFGVAVDLTAVKPFSVVETGATDAAFSALSTQYAGLLEEDFDWLDTGAGRVPAQVVVFFRRRNEQYGTEETVRNDSLQWATESYYSVTVSAPAQFAGAIGTHYFWDDFTVRYDVNNSPLAADTATAATIAADRVAQYYDNIFPSTGAMAKVYAGALPFKNGALVDGVAWTQDFADSGRRGWRTMLVRNGGDTPPWPGIWDDLGLATLVGAVGGV